MGDTDALRDKIAEIIDYELFYEAGLPAKGFDGPEVHRIALLLADAVLPVVTAALSSLRSRVEALADQLDNEAQRHDPDKRLDGKRFSIEMAEAFRASMTAKRDSARRLRSLSDNKEQQ